MSKEKNKKRSSERYINPVVDNYDKQNTYTELNRRRNISLQSKNYVEVVTYDYAMIEDRLLSILKHLELVTLCNSKYKIVKSIKNDFLQMYYCDDNTKHNSPSFSNISTKKKTINNLLLYTGKSVFLNMKKNILIQVNLEINIIDLIETLDKWCKKRNEVIHSIYNKNIDDLDKKLEQIALEGKNLSYSFSKICNLIKKYKKANNNK